MITVHHINILSNMLKMISNKTTKGLDLSEGMFAFHNSFPISEL